VGIDIDSLVSERLRILSKKYSGVGGSECKLSQSELNKLTDIEKSIDETITVNSPDEWSELARFNRSIQKLREVAKKNEIAKKYS